MWDAIGSSSTAPHKHIDTLYQSSRIATILTNTESPATRIPTGKKSTGLKSFSFCVVGSSQMLLEEVSKESTNTKSQREESFMTTPSHSPKKTPHTYTQPRETSQTKSPPRT